ncbi:MAG: RidA family protein [Deltaproteobacteria bacterium]|nr:RidA family protein [Deltaproteobacteria bacterium]MBW2068939.1 RidA family protein [Deltaproteobacteria bacterium]
MKGERAYIETNNAPKAIGPYSQAVKVGNIVFVSGQIGINPADGTIPETIEAQTEQVMKNLCAVLKASGASIDDVVKTTVYLTDINDFASMNRVYERFVKEHRPARACIEVSGLPRGARVEIDAIAVIT